MEEQEKGQKIFSDDYDSNGSGNVGTGLKILTNKSFTYITCSNTSRK